jgi:hypothetical protein
MEVKTENCFQNEDQMHRDMEVKTENCFQNEDQMHSLVGPWKNSMQMQPPPVPTQAKIRLMLQTRSAFHKRCRIAGCCPIPAPLLTQLD